MSTQHTVFGDFSYGDPQVGVATGTDQKFIVGKFCSIAPDVYVYLGGHHRTDWVSTFPFGHLHTDVFNTFDGKDGSPVKGNAIVGNDVWIGKGVSIMGGVKIGDGAVIAMNSHVVKDVEPYSIVGGNPARLIRYRFTTNQIDALLRIQWWNWTPEKINANLHLICQPDINKFIAAHQ